jgi:hypothetical protein
VQKGSEALPAEIGWLPLTKSKQQQLQQPHKQQLQQQQQQSLEKQTSKQQQQQQQAGSSSSIKLHQVICGSELTLKEVIGSGAEGKVRGSHAMSVRLEDLFVEPCIY